MIRRIKEQETLDPIVVKFCQSLQSYRVDGNQFSGDIDTSYSTRLTAATDNSIYQVIPQGIIFPKTAADIQILTRLANTGDFTQLKFSPRGGGTGTNGQSLTKHLVVDLSRHMRDILEINVEEKWVRVQTGVIKDQLNDFLRPYGFFFAPDLSTSNRATIGGMVNTDASGQGSLVYGKTSDHVLGLESVTVDGTLLNTKPISFSDAAAIAEGNTTEAALYKQVISTCREKRDAILSTFPRLNRFLTGYDLEHVFNDDLTEFDLSRVLTGSEGTLAFITEAKLNITPIAKFKTLINIKYDSFDSALRNSPFLVEANATSVETVDSKVLNLAKQDIVWDTVSELIQDVPDKVMDGLNIVEFNDEDETSQTDKVDSLCARLDELIESGQQGVIGYQVTNDLAAIGKIYGMRKKAVGLLGNAKSSKKPIAFAEDTAVPPENLADFIAEFRTLLDKHELNYGMFGHVDAGVLHVRPALDLCDPEQEKLLRSISDEVVALTAKYGGLMWGEHGKGYRSEYGPEFFGEELFLELRKIKSAFDPNNRLNPGKICTPINSNDELVSVDGVKRAKFDKEIPVEVKEEFVETVNCNGNGLCFSYDTSSPMCPSYKYSRDRRNSPKGRATLMREWLRLQGDLANDGMRKMSRVTLLQLLYWPYKLMRTLTKGIGGKDFNHEVKESMDACLACKACSTACPIKVDVPTFRAKFIESYYSRYLRPVSDHLVGNVERLLPLLAKTPKLSNMLAYNPISKWVTEKVIGYVDAPQFSEALDGLVPENYWYSKRRYESLNESTQSKTVFLVQDPFTSYYESQLVSDTVKALVALGYHPMILPFYPNGKPAHVKGFLAKFENTAAKATRFFNRIAELKRPMIGLDASLVFAYRDEYVKALGKERVQFEVSLLSEWLANEKIESRSQTTTSRYQLISHCTEKSVLPGVNNHWQTIFKTLGLELGSISTGCCGMAGTYGHEKANQEASRGIYDLSWGPALKDQDLTQVLATGFSCRSQVKRFESQRVKHPIQIVAEVLR